MQAAQTIEESDEIIADGSDKILVEFSESRKTFHTLEKFQVGRTNFAFNSEKTPKK